MKKECSCKSTPKAQTNDSKIPKPNVTNQLIMKKFLGIRGGVKPPHHPCFTNCTGDSCAGLKALPCRLSRAYPYFHLNTSGFFIIWLYRPTKHYSISTSNLHLYVIFVYSLWSCLPLVAGPHKNVLLPLFRPVYRITG